MPTPTGGGRTLSRDFKHVRRHTTVAAGQAYGTWVGFGIGLALGLAVALGVYLYDRKPGHLAVDEPVPVAGKPPASAAAPDDAVADAGAATAGAGPDFDFYDMLPKQEVEVPDTGKKPDRTSPAPLPTGEVVLQAGAFKQESEADRMIARLAVNGVVARKQRASVDDETWYRVRIGPIATVEELSTIRAKLQEAEITATPVTDIEEPPLP